MNTAAATLSTVVTAREAVAAAIAKFSNLRASLAHYGANHELAPTIERDLRWARIEIEAAEDDLEAACDACGIARI